MTFPRFIYIFAITLHDMLIDTASDKSSWRCVMHRAARTDGTLQARLGAAAMAVPMSWTIWFAE